MGTSLAKIGMGMPGGWTWVIGAIGLVVGVAVGAAAVRLLGLWLIARAREEAARLISSGRQQAEAEAKQVELAGHERLLAERERWERESQERRSQLGKAERELDRRDSKLERLEEQTSERRKELDRGEQSLADRKANVEEREAEAVGLLEQQREQLTRISGMSQEEARQALLERVEEDVKEEAARIIRLRIEESEAAGRDKAREVILQAMERIAGEHAAEGTVRTVAIPSDDLKGRIIGREGRNIRAIEKSLGVDLIVDDTPGVIVVSCFDKVRQAIAVESLTRLVADGRIHPARVEEVVSAVKAEFDEKIVKHGRDAQHEVKLRKLHPKIVEAMGRLHYRTSYGQNVLAHSIEVAFIAQMIADQLGLNGAIARRCGFLHDIGKAMDHEMEGGHPKIGMEFCAQYGEKEPALNAIGGHHGEIPSISFYTPIVKTADALSGARPGARRESLELYIKRLEQLQEIALENEGVEEAHAIQAGREVRVMVDAKRVSDDEAFVLARKIADRVSDEMTFPGSVRVTVLRETRAIEIAR